ncbi:MAG: hypothetical protein ACD_75C00029G0001 [uncultured bacterium]|nr:MAG: hypothetical protein ACD_75C00029G0001 [uncultured bacterium]
MTEGGEKMDNVAVNNFQQKWLQPRLVSKEKLIEMR